MSWLPSCAYGAADSKALTDMTITPPPPSLTGLGGQPLDSDLTDIAALTTTTLGRSLLTSVASAAYTQTFSTADRTHAARTATAVATTGATAVTPFGYTTAAQANDIVTQLNALRVDLADTAAVLNALIDDLQALGVIG